MKANAEERARLTTLLNAIDGGSPPPPDVVAWLRSEVQVKPIGRPPSPEHSLVRGALIESLIRAGTPRYQAIEAVVKVDPENDHQLRPCSAGTADRHLNEFRHTWVPALRRLLVEAQKVAISTDAVTAIASAAAKLPLSQRTERQP